jgi:trehalose 6-phosphate phosphatase
VYGPDNYRVHPQPQTTEGRAGLDAILAHPTRAVIGLDFDGTLAPIVPDPMASRAAPETRAALARLAPLLGWIVIITGRPAALAADLAGLHGLAPNMTVLGHYGWEQWYGDSDRVRSPAPPPGLDQIRAELPALVAGTGARVEDKHLSVAVHTRQADDPDATFTRLREPLTELAGRYGLRVEPGRRVLELRMPGMDKGLALTRFVRERAASAVAFVGDDLGDLPAFKAVEQLRREGIPGLTVCSGSVEVPELAGHTDLTVDGPTGVADLLADLADRLG